MCPACIASTLWLLAGATSSGGAAALAWKKLKARTASGPDSQT